MNLYSKIEPTRLLHIIQRRRDVASGRVDLVPADEFLQVATIQQPRSTTYQPHRHIVQERNEPEWIAQESWVVLSGTVQVTLYDLDDTVLHTDMLEAGDISITLHGGHTYMFCSESATVIEYKTGRYLGQEKDKVFI